MGDRKAPSLPPSERPKTDPVSRQVKPNPPPAPPRKSGGWIAFGRTFDEFKDVVGDPVGYEIVTDYQETPMLIGDINPVGGACDCCRDVSDTSVIVRYRQARYRRTVELE